LRHLACHRSGLRMTRTEDGETRVLGGANNDPKTFRRNMTYRLLIRQHYELDELNDETTTATTVGTNFFYGSGNYLVLGAVIEQLTTVSYEQAMQTRIFLPLGMHSAAFGMPIHDQVYYAPHGHRRKKVYPHKMIVDNTACQPIWNPAGSCYLTAQDWLKFLRLHANGSEGLLTLTGATLSTLHTPYPKQGPDDKKNYGFGWWIWSEPGGEVLDHNGHYFRFFARCQVRTGREIAVCAISNLGPNKNEDTNWEDKSSINAVGALVTHLVDKAIARQDTMGLPAPGTFAAGSRGSQGILHINIPEEEAVGIIIDELGGPFTRISMDAAEYAPVCLYQLDEWSRSIAAALRKPKAQAFTWDPTGVFRLRANTDIGAVYQVWRVPNLQSLAVLDMIDEMAATGLETEFEITPTPDARHEFFWVQDLEE